MTAFERIMDSLFYSPLVAAFAASMLTAFFTVVLPALSRWWRRPRLKIDLEERDGVKPYIHEFLEPFVGASRIYKCVCLLVRNGGHRPAGNCEAKMLVFENGRKEPTACILHWARRDPTVYPDPEKQFLPIAINRGDTENLNLLKLSSDAPHSYPYRPKDDEWSSEIEAMCLGGFLFQAHKKYEIHVTVFSSDTTPETREFRLFWDGTPKGFHTAVSKL